MTVEIEIDLQEVPTRKPRISVVVDEELLQYLEQWAEAEERSVSNLAVFLLKQATEAKKNREAQKQVKLKRNVEKKDNSNDSICCQANHL